MSKKQNLFLMSFIVATIGIAPAFAGGTGDAGCGLGSVIFSQNKILSQILAATTNGSFFSQTFGMTSGTSNCSASGFAKLDKEQIFYAESNFQNLSVEMAKGQGEVLQGFAQLFGCSGSGEKEFGNFTKSRFEKLIPTESTSAVEMLKNLKQELKGSSSNFKTCTPIG